MRTASQFSPYESNSSRSYDILSPGRFYEGNRNKSQFPWAGVKSFSFLRIQLRRNGIYEPLSSQGCVSFRSRQAAPAVCLCSLNWACFLEHLVIIGPLLNDLHQFLQLAPLGGGVCQEFASRLFLKYFTFVGKSLTRDSNIEVSLFCLYLKITSILF